MLKQGIPFFCFCHVHNFVANDGRFSLLCKHGECSGVACLLAVDTVTLSGPIRNSLLLFLLVAFEFESDHDEITH